jgi:precorrin isomerase
MTDNKRPLIHTFLENPMAPEEIEQRSFDAIDREAPPHKFSKDQWVVVRRMIHTTSSFDLMPSVKFSDDAISAAVAALCEGRPIYADSNMIRSGVSLARLRAVNPSYDEKSVVCHVADADVAEESKRTRLPRSLFAVRKARKIADGGIVIFGNAPVALLELNRMIMEDGIRPALVIAMPVGFVHVVESKEEFMKLGIPFVAVEGRRGGSTLAVSVIHSLCALAEKGAPERVPQNKKKPTQAVILFGHGSRVPGAGKGMETVAERLIETGEYVAVENAYMSRLGPHLPEILKKCVDAGATGVLLIPYFLHSGLHMMHDIPHMMRDEAKKYPGVKIVYGKHLGFDERMVEIVKTRIAESIVLDDIRNVELDSIDKFPLPPGELEYVSVTPEKARELRAGEEPHHHHDH